MSITFDGFVLRKPRISPANSPTTAEGDVFVRPQDKATYLSEIAYDPEAETTEYLVATYETANLVEPESITEVATRVDEGRYQFNAEGKSLESVLNVTPAPDIIDERAGLLYYDIDPAPNEVSVTWEPARLKINWTKNDARKRFGFQEASQRWTPLPGSGPQELGLLSASELLSLPVVEGFDATIVVGSPDVNEGVGVPTTGITEAEFNDYVEGILTVPVGTAVFNLDSGDILFASDIIDSALNQPVFFYRKSFFPYDEVTGALGSVGSSLYMNPMPLATESPRIRIAYQSYLKGQHSLVATVPAPGYDYVWSSETGRIYLDSSLSTEQEGKTVYYDGVYSNAEPLNSYDHEDLGTISIPPLPFSTPGLSFADVSAWDLDHTILYIRESGEAIATLEVVEEESGFTRSTELATSTAQVALDTGAVQLSLALARRNEGNRLWAGTGDFPIEKGISFRLSPSPLDPTNERGVPDAKGKSRVTNEVLSASLPPGPSYLLPQLPLQDIAGYGDNQFYRISRGPKKRILEPDVDVAYDFDARQLRWLEQESFSKVITSTSYTVQLPHQVLHDRNYTLGLNTGSGFEPVEEGDSALVDLSTGLLTFIERFGPTLYDDVGTITGATTLEASTADFTGLDIGTDPLLFPLLMIGSNVYRILSSTSNSVEVDRPFESSGSVRFVVLESPEIIYRYALEPATLRERTVFPYKVQGVSNYLPEGEAFEFVENDVPRNHVFLEPIVLGTLGAGPIDLVPPYIASTANYQIYLNETLLTEVASNPGPLEYEVQGTTLVFSASDIANNVGASIILDPALSDVRSTGDIEILASTRELNIPTDIEVADLRVWSLLREDQYVLRGNLLFFQEPVRSNTRLVVRYEGEGGILYEEEIGFRVLEDLGRVEAGNPVKTFASGTELDTQRPVSIRINGRPSNLEVDSISKSINTAGLRVGRRIEASYYVLDARGGEQTVSLLNTPVAEPVLFAQGDGPQKFRGDYTGILEPSVFMQVGPQSFEVVSATFDGTYTEVVLSSPVLSELRDPETLVSTTPITDKVVVPSVMEDTAFSVTNIRVSGNFTNLIKPSHLLYLDSDPYYVVASEYSDSVTSVTLSTATVQEYSTSTTLEVSRYPVYLPDTQVLQTEEVALVSEEVSLIRFDAMGVGTVLEDFVLEGSGRVILEPAVLSPPESGEIWYLAYTGLKAVGPKNIAGRTFLPRFRATYSRYVNATEENGYLGAVLEASFDFENPDTFYFRAVRMEEYAQEVARLIDLEAAARASSGGPILTLGSSNRLYEKGNEGLIYEEGNLRDLDRVGRAYLKYYNDVASLFESLLEIIDGRIVGDRDGKFLFEIQPDDEPGGIDPVEGELLPYYVNASDPGIKPVPSEIEVLNIEDQVGYVKNFIDDFVVTSRKPVTLEIGIPLSVVFQGTFKQAWEPHKLSRFYPESRQVFTITLPPRNGSSYSFSSDFGQLLADIKQEGILSVGEIKTRSAKAWVTESQRFAAEDPDGEARFYVASHYDEVSGEFTNVPSGPNQPIPSTWSPAFRVGDYVDMGRVTYNRNSDGTVDRTTTAYAQNMIVTSVGSDYIEVRQNSSVRFPDEILTDPTTVTPLRGDTIYTVAPVTNEDFVLGTDVPPFYRVPTDMSVNAADGELINNTLPLLLASLFGQSPVEPGQFLDVSLNFKNQELEPFRFPAMDGEVVNDDGDNLPPFVYPVQDSELQGLPRELDANQNVVSSTSEGLVFEGTVVNTVTIDAGFNIEATVPAPSEFDLVLIENELDGAESRAFSAQGTDNNLLKLAAFSYAEGSVNFEVQNLHEGSGEWDGSRWVNGAKDFTVFSGASLPGALTLYVDNGAGYSSYIVTALGNGFLETVVPVVEVGVRDYYVSIAEIGTIPASIDRIELVDVDFSEAQGLVDVLGTGPNAGIYQGASGGVGFLYVEVIPTTRVPGSSVRVAVSRSEIVDAGVGAVDNVGSILTVNAALASEVEVGQTLLISSTSINGGRYLITAINGLEIEVGSILRPEGEVALGDYPINWRITKPRRFSEYLESLHSEVVRQRVTYASNTDAPLDVQPFLNATSSNPSTPFKERLEELISLLFGNPVLTVNAGYTTAPDTFGSGTLDFVASGIEVGDYVLVTTGVNRGFYPITGVTTSELTVTEQNTYTAYLLTTEASTTFEVYRASQFTNQTYELVLYEYINVLEQVARLDALILGTIHDPTNFIANELFNDAPGDPSDSVLALHEAFIEGRLDWLRDEEPTLRQEIDAILKGREALYDIRFTWVDFRINLENGTLPRRKRFAAQKEKRKKQQLKDLIKQLST